MWLRVFTLLIGALVVLPLVAGAQPSDGDGIPRMPWGDPDLEGPVAAGDHDAARAPGRVRGQPSSDRR